MPLILTQTCLPPPGSPPRVTQVRALTGSWYLEHGATQVLSLPLVTGTNFWSHIYMLCLKCYVSLTLQYC